MAIGLNDILRVKTFFHQGSNEALMVSYWTVSEIITPNTYAALAQAFGFTMMVDSRVQDLVSATATLDRVVIDNLSKPLEFGEWVEDFVGIATGDPAPAFNAVSIKQSVGTRTTRAGYKRIPFISEQIMNGNTAVISGITETALLAFWGQLYNFLYSDPVNGDTEILMFPTIVGRTLNEDVPPTYEEDLTRINPVTGASIQGITSQVSRKV